MAPAPAPAAISRWVPVLAALALEVCGGSIYITGLYTSDLKERFFSDGTGQAQVEQLVFACNLGNWLPASGFFFDSRLGGARNTVLAASIFTLIGYAGLWAWSARLVELSYWQVWCLWFLWGHGSGWFDCAAVTTASRNFPLQQGSAMALIKAFYGLSGSLLTQVFNVFFFGQTSGFLLFLAVFLGGVGVLISPFVYLVPDSAHCERDQPDKRFRRGLGTVLGLAALLLVVALLRVAWGSPRALNVLALVAVSIVLAFLTSILPGSWVAVEPGDVGVGAERGAPPGEAGQALVRSGAAAARDVPPRRAWVSIDFWLLFSIVFVGMGGGLVVLNHIGQMVDALGGGESMRAILVSLVSVANCLGRVLFGVAPDALAVGAPRALFLAANLVLMGCAQLLLSLGSLPSLVAGAALAGFSYGGFWTLSPAMLAELFGRRWIATIYNSMSLAVSSASLVFSTVLASHFYDVQSGLHPAGGGAGCTGPTCYRLTHLIMASAAGAGLVSAAVLRDRARRRRGALSPEVDLADRAAAARC